MTRKIICGTICLVFLLSQGATITAHASMAEESDPDIIKEYETYYMFDRYQEEMSVEKIADFVETPAGGIDWRVFAETEQIPHQFTDEQGYEWQGYRPDFQETLKKLDGADILLQGYMFPLDANEAQARFLFGPFPASCPFHYHVTNNLIIEVHASQPIQFTYDAIDIRGRLELVETDDDFNVFYRLHDAVLQK